MKARTISFLFLIRLVEVANNRERLGRAQLHELVQMFEAMAPRLAMHHVSRRMVRGHPVKPERHAHEHGRFCERLLVSNRNSVLRGRRASVN